MSRMLGLMLSLGLATPASAVATVTYVHTDALGSPIMETDTAGNKLAGEVDYRAFGEEVLRGPQTGVGFTGHYRDAGTGFVYMQQRYYDPAVGRFVSIDPVSGDDRGGGNFNRYWYANNNPHKYVDPDGRFGIPGALVGAAIEIGSQVFLEGKSITEIDKSDVIVAAAVGAVTGGLGGKLATNAMKGSITAASAVKQTAAAGAAASAIGNGVKSLANGEAPSAGDMAGAAGAGALGSGAGAKLGVSAAAKLDRMSKGGGVAANVADSTRSTYVGAGVPASTSAGQGMASQAADVTAAAAETRMKEKPDSR